MRGWESRAGTAEKRAGWERKHPPQTRFFSFLHHVRPPLPLSSLRGLFTGYTSLPGTPSGSLSCPPCCRSYQPKARHHRTHSNEKKRNENVELARREQSRHDGDAQDTGIGIVFPVHTHTHAYKGQWSGTLSDRDRDGEGAPNLRDNLNNRLAEVLAGVRGLSPGRGGLGERVVSPRHSATTATTS